MSAAPPNVAASVRASLLNVAKAQGVDFNQVLVRFVHTAVTRRTGSSASGKPGACSFGWRLSSESRL